MVRIALVIKKKAFAESIGISYAVPEALKSILGSFQTFRSMVDLGYLPGLEERAAGTYGHQLPGLTRVKLTSDVIPCDWTDARFAWLPIWAMTEPRIPGIYL